MLRDTVFLALAAALVAVDGSSSAQVNTARARETITGAVQPYVVARGDTVTRLSARFGVEAAVIIADNRLGSSGALRVGQTLQLDTRHIIPTAVVPETVVINIPQRILFHAAVDAVTAIPVSVGRSSWATPIGSFTVAQKAIDPTWHVPASIREEARLAGRQLPAEVPPGPTNPLGRFWMGLSAGGIGIHGTNAPASIYRTVTHGCVRLHPTDIEWLFSRVPKGGAVRTIYEPMLLTEKDSRVFLEVHPDAYGLHPTTLARARALAREAGLTDQIDWDIVRSVVAERLGVVRDVTKETRATGAWNPRYSAARAPSILRYKRHY
jgi:L,D-transpeptidase ErfK/SrfK